MREPLTTRLAPPEDAPLLWQMLTFAASMEGAAEDVARAQIDPELRGYVERFGRAGDLGVGALRGERPAGAAWLRLLVGEARATEVWTHEVPELAIAVMPDARGGGVGSVLLRALIEAAAGRYPAFALLIAAPCLQRCRFGATNLAGSR